MDRAIRVVSPPGALLGVVAGVLAACAADPDAHFDVTRAAGEVTAQLCDPALLCKTSLLFAGDEAEATVKTLDIFISDGTTELDLIFSQNTSERFCTRIAVTFTSPIDATIALAGDAATPPSVAACEACRIEPCNP